MVVAAAPAAPQQPAPGQLFGLPGVTQLTSQKDNNDGVVTALAQATQAPATQLVPFKDTDVVFWWDFDFAWTNTVTLGAGTVGTSRYFPYNILGPTKIQVQNMYPALDAQSGIDLYIWQVIRPMLGTDFKNQDDSTPIAAWAGLATSLQSNLVSGQAFTSASTAITFSLEFPVSLFFDLYYELTKEGGIAGPPHRAVVSPQFMAGSARVVQPQITFSPGLAANLDAGPFDILTAGPTYAGSVALGVQRRGIYGSNNPAYMPVVYNWQYIRQSKQQSLAGASQKDLTSPTQGQILSIFVRLFDPSVAGGGDAIDLSQVVNCIVTFGSGLYRFQDTPKVMQKRFIRQHGVLLPKGVMAWDFATDEYGRTTNVYALNTLTTAGITVHLDFLSALSATAYAVVGVDALVYIE